VRALLLASLRDRPGTLARVVGWSLLEMVPIFLSGYAVAQAIDRGFLAGRQGVGLVWLALAGAGVAVGAWGTRGVIPHLGAIVEPLRDRLVTRVVQATLHQAVAGSRADATAIARLTTQVEAVRTALASLLTVVRGFALAVAGALLGLLALSPAALLFTVPPILVGLAVFRAGVPRLLARQDAVNRAEEQVTQTGGTAIGALRDIAATGGNRYVHADVTRHIDRQVAASRALARASTLRYAALGIGGTLPLLAVVLAVPWLLRQGTTAGQVLGLVTYLVSGVQPALRTLVNGVGGNGVVLTATLRRLIDLTAYEPRPAVLTGSCAGADLMVEGASFTYPGGAEPVLHKIDLKIPEGDHLVVVGPSGAGKSTLALLLSGLLTPTEGTIQCGVRSALIPQEAYIFGGTLRENLSYLCGDVTDQQLEQAARKLGLASVIARLGGLDAPIAVTQLSAGERQLIAATRTYLAPAPLVLLDEATCHLDPQAEELVERAFAQRPGTLVIVAHRLSSALRAKHVLVLDGAQSWHGTNLELERTCPVYRELIGYWSANEERHGLF
jgi:ATP-binding cassette subfamily C protein